MSASRGMAGARGRCRGSKEGERLEEVERAIASIRRLDEGSCILVEGRRDRDALRSLGIGGDIICLRAGRGTISERLERISAVRIIVLVDFDPEGKDLAKLVSRLLERAGRSVDLSFWRRLRAYLGRDVRGIEGLVAYVERRST